MREETDEGKWVAGFSEKRREMEQWKKQSIYRVPTYIADICSRYYRPQLVSIGPFYHDHPNLKKMQIHKRRALHHFLNRSDKPKEAYLKVLEEEVQQLMDAYEELDPIWLLNRGKFLELMVLDGCFLLEILRIATGRILGDYAYNDPVFGENGMLNTIGYMMRDLLMVENQVPLMVLERLLSVEKGTPREENQEFLVALIIEFFPWRLPAPATGRKIGHHLLDVFRQSLLAERCTKKLPLFRTHNLLCSNNVVFRSAKELDAAGVQFQKMDRYGLEDMAFRDGVLFVPVMVVGDYYSKTAFLNLIAFERLHPDTHHEVTSYVFFIKSLITSAEDVALLRSEGILEIAMGTDESTAELFNKLVEDVYINPSSRAYMVQLQLHAFYMDSMKKWNKRLRRWRYYLKETHFRSPWTVLSLMAAVFLVGLTFVQTIFSVLSFYQPLS